MYFSNFGFDGVVGVSIMCESELFDLFGEVM